MAINYYEIFRQRIGQMDATTVWDDARVESMLDQTAVKKSRKMATPWADFASVPEAEKWPITLMAALDYWWARAGSLVDKANIRSGTGVGKQADDLFDRAIRMIRMLQDEIEELTAGDATYVEGSGDILIGDLVKRSKETGYIVPRADDPRGDWTS